MTRSKNAGARSKRLLFLAIVMAGGLVVLFGLWSRRPGPPAPGQAVDWTRGLLGGAFPTPVLAPALAPANLRTQVATGRECLGGEAEVSFGELIRRETGSDEPPAPASVVRHLKVHGEERVYRAFRDDEGKAKLRVYDPREAPPALLEEREVPDVWEVYRLEAQEPTTLDERIYAFGSRSGASWEVTVRDGQIEFLSSSQRALRCETDAEGGQGLEALRCSCAD